MTGPANCALKTKFQTKKIFLKKNLERNSIPSSLIANRPPYPYATLAPSRQQGKTPRLLVWVHQKQTVAKVCLAPLEAVLVALARIIRCRTVFPIGVQREIEMFRLLRHGERSRQVAQFSEASTHQRKRACSEKMPISSWELSSRRKEMSVAFILPPQTLERGKTARHSSKSCLINFAEKRRRRE